MIEFSKYDGSEDQFQMAVSQFLNFKGVLWCHVPNEIKAKPAYYKKRAAKGVKAGVPDVLIFEPRGKYHGFIVELKVDNNKTTDNQKKWLQSLENRNYKVMVSYSLDEVMNEVNKYLDL